MRLAILAAAAAFCAGAAYAQDDPCKNGQYDKAKEAFVLPFNAALTALTAKDWRGALASAAQARPHAMSGYQVAAVVQIQVAAISETSDRPTLAAAMQAALDVPCLAEPVRNSYAQQLARLRGGGTASQR